MKKLCTLARLEELRSVIALVNEELERFACSDKTRNQIELAVEEVFVNIVRYSYGSEGGTVEIQVESNKFPPAICIRIADEGMPFNPLAKPDTDVTLPPEQREPGGLGIYLIKKNMDQVTYRFERGQNILTMQKFL